MRPAKSRGDRWLLCERSLATDERKYYLLNLPETATLRELVTLARSRWPIEQQDRELKDELGFDHFEGRTYRGWTHHVVLTAIAFTFLQLERRRDATGARPTLPTVRCLGARDHGLPVHREHPAGVEHHRQFSPESAATKMTK